MTSKRESIMASFATQLATITVINGYNTTVVAVERWVTAPDLQDNDPADFPLVVLEEGDETIDYHPASMAMSSISFKIHAMLKGTTTVSPTTLNAFIEDVRQLVESNKTAGGNAIDVTVQSITLQHHADIPYAVAVLDVSTEYLHDVDTP